MRPSYHITSKTYFENYYAIPITKVWRKFEYYLDQGDQKYEVDIQSYVLMGNHYHLILRGDHAEVLSFMQYFSMKLKKIFNPEYSWVIIRSKTYLKNSYIYLHQNPVRAGLVKRCEDYPYSSLKSKMPIIDPFGFNDGYKYWWLNQQYFEAPIKLIS